MKMKMIEIKSNDAQLRYELERLTRAFESSGGVLMENQKNNNKIARLACFQWLAILGLIIALICLSIARSAAMDRADAMQAAAEEHKANEERLVNELTAAIEQKSDIENELIAVKLQKPEIVEVEVIKEVEVPPLNDYSDIKMTEEEKDLLWWVTALEAKEQPDVGQRGVIEVVFNRVQSPDWPNTVEKVLTQKGQFDGYDVLMEYRAGIRSKLYAYPDEKEAKNIDFVLKHGRTALPADYVFFATYKANGSGFLQIADHYFAKASR